MTYHSIYKYIICIVVCTLLLSCTYDLTDVSYKPLSGKELNHNDTIIRFHYLPSNTFATQKPAINLYYYWLDDEKLLVTKGNYSGHLLDGKYEAFFPNGQLKTKGQFFEGLKNKQWLYYYPDGKIKRIEAWDQGKIHGLVLNYSESQRLIQKTQYIKGRLHGLDIIYHMDTIVSKNRYVKGKKKERKKLFQKLGFAN